jgi:predicted MPP superfamily phosphohydrolase
VKAEPASSEDASRALRTASPVRRRSKGWLIAAAVVVLLIAAFVGYSFGETFRLEVKEYTFASPDVPPAFDGTRIILLTDIHRTWYFSQDRVGRVVDKVNALEPDLIVLGGDYIYRSTEYEASVFEELGRLEAPLGTFAVLGNHDYGQHDRGNDGSGPVREAIAATNITLLDNAAVWIEDSGERIRLGGVGDLSQDRPRIYPTIDGTQPGDLVLLASHNPDFSEFPPPGSVDLVLSGHTHGGQITFFGLFPFSVPSEYGQKYWKGMVSNSRTTVIVSNGIGSIYPPLRFFAPPQIVVVTLEATG